MEEPKITEVWSPTFVELMRRGLDSEEGRVLLLAYIRAYCSEIKQHDPQSRAPALANLATFEALAHGLEGNTLVDDALRLMRGIGSYERASRRVPTEPLVGFLYDLMRDHLPLGVVEALTRVNENNGKDGDIKYSNEDLAAYARKIAHRLVRATKKE